jgi:hypothetical protein
MDRNQRAEQMRRLLARREREHLTFRETAALEPGVTVNQLFWWRRRLQTSVAPTVLREPPPKPFVELVETGTRDRSCARIEIVTRGERRIVIDADLDEPTLVRLVRALGRC